MSSRSSKGRSIRYLLAIALCLNTRSIDAFVSPRSRTLVQTPYIGSSVSPVDRLIGVAKFKKSSTSLAFFFDKHKDAEVKANANSDGNSNAIDYSSVKPQVFPQRWVQLGYLSFLALLSDWVCFSVAAAPDTFESRFGHSASSIIDIFLFTNVATCFLVTDVVSKFGLQRSIQAAAVIMTLGTWARSGLGFLPGQSGLVDYWLVVLGTVLVGIAQPFFQCTPPLLSAKWFANNERSTSTAIALNFNQIGIATAFLVGGAMATSTTGLENYFGLIAVMTTLVTAGTLFQFQDEPPIPPSASELEKKIRNEHEPPFLESVQKFFKTRGFTNALAAFICSISLTNIVGVRHFPMRAEIFTACVSFQ